MLNASLVRLMIVKTDANMQSALECVRIFEINDIAPYRSQASYCKRLLHFQCCTRKKSVFCNVVTQSLL